MIYTLVGFGLAFCLFLYIIILKFGIKREQSSSKTKSLQSISKSDNQNLLEAFSEGVIICSLDGKIMVMNSAASKLTGWGVSDSINLDFQSVVSFVDENNNTVQRENSPIYTAINQQTTVQQTLQIVNNASREKIFTNITVSPSIFTDHKHIIAIISSVDDKIKQDVERSDFVSTASHEMRTPVAAIKGFLELSLNPKICKIDENAKKYLTKAHDATEHLGKLFQDLLTVSRSEDGRLPNNPVKTNLSDFINELVEQLNFTAQAKNLKLTLALDGANITEKSKFTTTYLSFVDPVRLREVITNLFDNAVKYTEEGGISVNLRGSQSSVIIDIRDSGIGIPKEDLAHIFQKFYRVDNSSTREIGGTGLGLYICKEIIEVMHGTITVNSTVGAGSTFTITLPRVY